MQIASSINGAYPSFDGISVGQMLGDPVADALRTLHALTGYDALRSPDFWELQAAQALGGEQSARGAPFDVRVDIWGIECFAEVKFSQAFWAEYGKHSRNVFKWVLTKSQDANRHADAIILIGVDEDSLIYSWVIPYRSIPEGKRSITVTAPSSRLTGMRGRIDTHQVPATEILPAFAACCHNRLDAKGRAINAAITRHEKNGQLNLIGRDG